MQLGLWDASLGEPRVRFSERARRVAVRVHLDGGIELVVPRGVSERHARAFFDSRSEWIAEQVRRRRALWRPQAPFPPDTLELSALGERWRLHLAAGSGRARIEQVAEGCLSLRGQGDGPGLRRVLRRWLLAHARAAFEPRLAELASQFGFHYRTLCVRTQRSRWGSCSTRGAISLNLALLFQTPAVLRYLMCHELAHTRHMNHSAAFWRCVAACEPQWQRLDRELGQGWARVPHWLLAREGES